jgi:hypothetical protein
MKKELAAPVLEAAVATPGVLWSLLLGELAIGSLLFLSDRLPPVLFRSLQLFLRF